MMAAVTVHGTDNIKNEREMFKASLVVRDLAPYGRSVIV
jgi:hypothetical protein